MQIRIIAPWKRLWAEADARAPSGPVKPVSNDAMIDDASERDAGLLARSRKQWQLGNWSQLTHLTVRQIETHPDRAVLALLAAAGLAQTGELESARDYARLSLRWGCDRYLVGTVLISGVHNTLGKMANLFGSDALALEHFGRAVRLTRLGGEPTDLMVHARAASQTKKPVVDAGADYGAATEPLLIDPNIRTNAHFSEKAFTFYSACVPQAETKFVFLDVKSLPRTGLHYIKNSLEGVLGQRFSFCEWYQEPGCCKRMPCALSGYAEECFERKRSALRMAKSHDFDLTDPIYPTNVAMRRLILVRDPLYILTSWWTLDVVVKTVRSVPEARIEPAKIDYSHERPVLASAYKLVDRYFKAPSDEELKAWLDKRSAYIIGFVKKWGAAAHRDDMPGQRIVRYKETPHAVVDLLTELCDDFAPDEMERLERYVTDQNLEFRARSDPFSSASDALTLYLHSRVDAFSAAKDAIIATDNYGVFDNL